MNEALPRDRLSRALRVVAAAIGIGGGVLLVAAILVANLTRPSLRHDPPKLVAKSLQRSVEKEVGTVITQGDVCRPRGRGAWTCTVNDRGGSGGGDYAVTATSEHCWRATLVSGSGEGLPHRPSGCVW